jgi:hypothetical protein
MTDAKITGTALCNGFANFQMEYGRLPASAISAKGDIEKEPSDHGLIDALLPASLDENTRGHSFFNTKEAKNGRSGLVYIGATLSADLRDPWGNPYYVSIDADGDGILANPETGSNRRSLCFVFSAGPDGDPDTWKDNPKSF